MSELTNIYIIPTLTAFPGDKEVSIVWSKPENVNSFVIYEYNILEDPENNLPNPANWIRMGTEQKIRKFNNDNRFNEFLPYIIKNLENDIKYRIYVRAIVIESREVALPVSFDNTTYVDVKLSEFKSNEPNPERVMKGLDDKFLAKKNKDSILYKIFEKIALHLKTYYVDLVEKGLVQLNILTATGEYVDNWGVLFGVSRQANETDSEYGARIVRTFTIEKGTASGIKKAIQPYSSSDVIVIEGNNNYNSFVFDNSYFDFDPYNSGKYLLPELVPETIPEIPEEPINRAGQLYEIPEGSGNYEYLYGNELGAGSTDSFVFILRFNPIPTGDPLSIENTFLVVNEIIRMYKLAGVEYSIEIEGI